MSTLDLRPLNSHHELLECVELQRTTWGRGFDDVVSAALMGVAQKIGGIAAGAFEGSGALVGILFGLTGIRDDSRVHWSHMLAVRPDWRGKSLGTAMKVYQRCRVMSLGVDRMYWTFDPLEARNAHFNLNRLGVRIDDYVVDMYGPGDTSTLHSGIGTDRFVAIWRLDAPRVQERIAGVEGMLSWDAAGMEATLDTSAPIFINVPEPSLDLIEQAIAHETTEEWPQSSAPKAPRFVEIPADIQRLKSANPDDATAWRTMTRAAFTHSFSQGLAVTAFIREPQSGRCFYVLDHPNSDSRSAEGT